MKLFKAKIKNWGRHGSEWVLGWSTSWACLSLSLHVYAEGAPNQVPATVPGHPVLRVPMVIAHSAKLSCVLTANREIEAVSTMNNRDT